MRFLVAVLLVLSWASSAAAGGFGRAETPDWVIPAKPPEIDPSLRGQLLDGVYEQLFDRQVSWQGSEQHFYQRMVVEILSPAGVDHMGSVTRKFDPSIDSLDLLDVLIHRDGKVIDLKSKIRENVFRREEGLDRGIVDGTLTAHFEIPDLRVGDVVDLAFLWRTTSLFDGDDRSLRRKMEYGVPPGLTRVVVNWPARWPWFLRQTGQTPAAGAIRHETVELGDIRRHVFSLPAMPTTKWERDAPSENEYRAGLEVSAFDSWTQAVAGLADHYEGIYALPPEWVARVDAIRAQHDTPDARATAALRMVQDDIRYVGVEIGKGGYFARSPRQVVANGFGDCKDKSVLLVAMLRALDIPSEVVLANIDNGHGLIGRLPTPHAFDHMIVQARINGKLFWLDPTISFQGGSVTESPPPDYGFVLPLTADGPTQTGEGLVRITDLSEVPHRQQMTETFSFGRFGMTLKVKTVYRGVAADDQRYVWATRAHDNLRRHYREYYEGLYPGIVVLRPAAMSDMRDRNEVVIRESYRLPLPAMNDPELREDFVFQAGRDYRELYPDNVSLPRKAPLSVPHPVSFGHKVVIRNAPIEFRAPGTIALENGAFAYKFSASRSDGGNMEIYWNLDSRSRSVLPETLPALRRDLNAMDHSRSYWWDLTPAEPEEQGGDSFWATLFKQGETDKELDKGQ